MTMVEATKTCLRKYLTFSGRAGRPEFWKFVLAIFLAQIILVVINSLIFGPSIEEGISVTLDSSGNQTTQPFTETKYTGGWLGDALSLAVFLPMLTATWRRLHDTGRPGWFVLVPWAVLAVMAAIWMFAGEDIVIGTLRETGEPITTKLPPSVASVVIPGGVAFIAFVALIVFLALASQPGPNKYGPNPHEVTQ